MRNKNIVDAYDSIEFSDATKNRMLEKTKQKTKKSKKHPVFRTAISLATTAAVLMFALFGQRFFAPDVNNTFLLQAFAMEVQEDGTVGLRMLEYANFHNSLQYGTWHGHYDGENFYLNIAIGIIGENIKQVEFTTDVGFFAKQFIDRESFTEDTNLMTSGGRILMFGTDFEIVGNSFVVDESFIADDWILFLGQEGYAVKNRTVRAVATFNDGTTQEEVITINLEESFGLASVAENAALEHQARFNATNDFIMNIPLDDLELIPESVKTFTEVYEFDLVGDGARPMWFQLFDFMEDYFDENGILARERSSWSMWDDETWSILVIKRNNDGTFTGMVYLVPQELIEAFQAGN